MSFMRMSSRPGSHNQFPLRRLPSLQASCHQRHRMFPIRKFSSRFRLSKSHLNKSHLNKCHLNKCHLNKCHLRIRRRCRTSHLAFRTQTFNIQTTKIRPTYLRIRGCHRSRYHHNRCRHRGFRCSNRRFRWRLRSTIVSPRGTAGLIRINLFPDKTHHNKLRPLHLNRGSRWTTRRLRPIRTIRAA